MSKLKKVLKKIGIGFILFLVLLITVLAISIPYGKSKEKPIPNPGKKYSKVALVGGNILTMNTDSIYKYKNIYLENGIITNILSDTIEIPKDYIKINAKGKFIMPGLIDMHAHIFDRNDLTQYLSYGVTTVRNMMGFPMHLRWKQQLLEGEIPGSNLITATPTINSGNNAGPFHKTIENTTEAKEAITTYAKAGYDFIKVYDDVTSEQIKAIQEVAKSNGLMIAGHPPKMSLEKLLSSSIISIEHVEELRKFLDKENSDASILKLAESIKKSNKAVTINLLAFHRIYKTSHLGSSYLVSLHKNSINPIIKFIGNKQLEEYTQAGSKYKAFAKSKFNTLQKLAKALNDESVTILLGTDAGPNFITPGKSVIEEIELLSDAGIPAYDILKSATINASKVLQQPTLGTIKIGNTSKLLILNDNPLEDLTTLQDPSMIFTNEFYYTEKEINRLRTLGENKQSSYTTIGLFLEHLIQ